MVSDLKVGALMKKLSYFTGALGMIFFFVAGSCNFEDFIAAAVFILIGLAMICISYLIERSFCFEDENDLYIDSSDDCSDNSSFDDFN